MGTVEGLTCRHCGHGDAHNLPKVGKTGEPFGYCADCLGCRAPAVWVATDHEFGLTDKEQAELDNVFSYHAPVGDQVDRYGVIRAQARQLARVILAYSMDSEERRQALFAVRNAVMWANAGIACNEPGAGE